MLIFSACFSTGKISNEPILYIHYLNVRFYNLIIELIDQQLNINIAYTGQYNWDDYCNWNSIEYDVEYVITILIYYFQKKHIIHKRRMDFTLDIYTSQYTQFLTSIRIVHDTIINHKRTIAHTIERQNTYIYSNTIVWLTITRGNILARA